MTVESEADRRALLADFGETVTYTVEGGEPVSLLALVSAAYVEVSEHFGTGIASSGTAIKVLDVDLPAGAGQFDRVARADGKEYQVTEPKADGTGFTILALERV